MTIGTTEKLKQKNIILNLTGLLVIIITEIVYICLLAGNFNVSKKLLLLLGGISIFYVVVLLPVLIILTITGVIKNIQAKTKIKIINVIIIFLDFAVGIGIIIVQASSF